MVSRGLPATHAKMRAFLACQCVFDLRNVQKRATQIIYLRPLPTEQGPLSIIDACIWNLYSYQILQIWSFEAWLLVAKEIQQTLE